MICMSVLFGPLIQSSSSSLHRQQQWTCSQQAVCSILWSVGGSTLLVMHWDDKLTSCQENIHSRILWRIYMVRNISFLAWFMLESSNYYLLVGAELKLLQDNFYITLRDLIPAVLNFNYTTTSLSCIKWFSSKPPWAKIKSIHALKT